MMYRPEDDPLMRQIMKIAQEASQEALTRVRRPGKGSIDIFLGGAHAGEIIKKRSTTVQSPDGKRQQVTLEIVSDPTDPGDTYEERDILSEPMLPVTLPTRGRRDLVGLPEYRTFTLGDDGVLYATHQIGVTTGTFVEPTNLNELVYVTSDPQVATQVWDMIQGMPLDTKGRILYAAFMKLYLLHADEFSYDLMDHRYGNMNFEERRLLQESRERLSSMKKVGEGREDTDPHEMEEFLIEQQGQMNEQLAWLYYYRGKVPPTWQVWSGVEASLVAHETLDVTSLEAAASHPNWNVLNALCREYFLTTGVFAIVLANINSYSFMTQEEKDSVQHQYSHDQIKQGMTVEEVVFAKDLAIYRGKAFMEAIRATPHPLVDLP